MWIEVTEYYTKKKTFVNLDRVTAIRDNVVNSQLIVDDKDDFFAKEKYEEVKRKIAPKDYSATEADKAEDDILKALYPKK